MVEPDIALVDEPEEATPGVDGETPGGAVVGEEAADEQPA